MLDQNRDEALGIVRRYLELMEARDLESAAALQTGGSDITFPGGVRFSSLEEIVSWSKSRYRWVKKKHDHADTCELGDGVAVYCFGTLHGEWLDGTSFEGIRFIDRFEVAQGLIRRQMVWNDLAEYRTNSG